MMQVSARHKEFLLLLGYRYMEHNMYERAVVVYAALSEFFADDAYILKCLAFSLLEMEEHERALSIADQSLRLQMTPEDVKILQFIRGRALWHLGRREEARASALEALNGGLTQGLERVDAQALEGGRSA